ncbi:carbohydrate binding domain-containing protein [Euzebyella saccharophila]|uniref:Carbohydrate binding domain-containing protein n=1 Tax=Euzebyella saccharophila TaxID=679664 RepID=A0ABV8JSU6_9FLAO|nr:carbohydrate binding domain-containing protein [Euzebyella saccharophila]
MVNHIKYRKLGVIAYMLLMTGLLVSSCESDDDSSTERISSTVHMKTLPKVKYVLGDELDLSEIVLTIDKEGSSVDVPFSSFSSENISVEPANGTVLDFSHEQVTIKVGDSGQGIIQAISVTNNVVAIEVKTKATENYINGQMLDLNDLVVTLIREDGATTDVAYSDFDADIETSPVNGDILEISNSEIDITYIATNVKVAQNIQVVPFSPATGTIVSMPTKGEYKVGELLELEGTSIHFTMEDGQEIDIPFENFEDFGLTATPAHESKLKLSDSEVEIMHSNGTSIVVPITVNALDVVGMTMEMKPEKTLYKDGEAIDLKGLILRLEVNGQEDLLIANDDFDIYGINSSPAQEAIYTDGTSEIVVSYPDLADTVVISLGSEIIYESDFSADVDGWQVNQNGGGAANVLIEDGILVAKDIVVGTNPWDVQLFKPSLLLEKDAKYKLTVHVKAYPGNGDFWFSMSVGDGTGRDGWQAYDGGGGVWLAGDTEYQTYEKEFVMGLDTTNGARILLDIGNQTNAIMVQFVKLEKL